MQDNASSILAFRPPLHCRIIVFIHDRIETIPFFFRDQDEAGWTNRAFRGDDEHNNRLPSPSKTSGEVQPETKQLSEVENAQKAKREREPLFFCKILTEYPKTSFGKFLLV